MCPMMPDISTEKESPMKQNENNYDDMLDMPPHKSTKHPPMALASRAAQFSPFAALSGYEDAIKQTEQRMEEREKELEFERKYF